MHARGDTYLTNRIPTACTVYRTISYAPRSCGFGRNEAPNLSVGTIAGTPMRVVIENLSLGTIAGTPIPMWCEDLKEPSLSGMAKP